MRPCSTSRLQLMFGEYGKTARIPTLWIYSENDQWMGPTFPREWFQAYKENGGTGEFVLYPPHGQDGHNLFVEGINVWRPQAFQWLKTNGYPELTAPEVKP